ncbi:putative ABC transporter ATP-binding protein [compost metagenome]
MQTVKYTWFLFQGNYRRLFVGFLILTLSSVLVIIPPIAIGKMIDYAFPSKNINTITVYASIITLSLILSFVMQMSSKYILENLIVDVVKSMKERIFRLYQTKHLHKVLALGFDELYQRITNSTQKAKEDILLITKDFLGVFISGVLSLVVIGRIDILIPVLFVLVYIPYIMFRRYLFKIKGHSFHEQAESYSSIIQSIRENIQGIRLIKVNSKEDEEMNLFQKKQKKNIRIQINHINFFSQLVILNILANLIPECIVYAYLGAKVHNGFNSIGDIIIVIGLLAQIRLFIWQISRFSIMMKEYQVHLNRIYEIENIEEEPYNIGQCARPIEGHISFQNITFRYQNQIVLDKLSLDILQGQSFGIVGLSGAGKTTLANLVIGLEKPENGVIYLDGIPLSQWNIQALRQNVSFITQQPYLLNSSIRNNLTYGLDEATDEQIWNALKRVNLYEFVNEMEDKLDTVIGEQGIQLSGGQKQRLVISRAYLQQSSIVILDEATAALDLESEHQVQMALNELAKGLTSIVIAHRLSTLHDMDCIVVIHNGKVVEKGSHKELIGSNGHYKCLYLEQYHSVSSSLGQHKELVQ